MLKLSLLQSEDIIFIFPEQVLNKSASEFYGLLGLLYYNTKGINWCKIIGA